MCKRIRVLLSCQRAIGLSINYLLSILEESSLVLVFLASLSIVYWYKSRTIFRSLHGVILISGYIYAVIISEYTNHGSSNYYYWPFWGLLLLGLVVAGVSFTLFKGERWVHSVHIFTLLSAAWLWLVGSMRIAHDWL
jgi:hypothetical protein